MTRMFNIVEETWNPVTGCPHNCIYCWARKLAETKLKNANRYKDGFKSRLNLEEFNRKFRGKLVFVSDMGDLFAETVPDEWILKVLNYIRKFPSTSFLFLTKNPARYHRFEFPRNAILGATIETDDDTLYRGISNAPPPSSRIKAMEDLDWMLKFVSIEPILDFTDNFPSRILGINPSMVYVGYDNYGNRLPEPRFSRTKWLMEGLRKNGIEVREKTIRPAWYELP